MPRPRVAVVIAPWRTETDPERRFRERVTKELVHRGWCPVFLPLVLSLALNDDAPEERITVLACSDAFVRSVALDPEAAAVVLGKRYTEGMALDMASWWDAGGKCMVYVETPDSPVPNAWVGVHAELAE